VGGGGGKRKSGTISNRTQPKEKRGIVKDKRHAIGRRERGERRPGGRKIRRRAGVSKGGNGL